MENIFLKMQVVKVKNIIHRNNNFLAIKFVYDTSLINQVKKISNVKWSKTHTCWYIPQHEEGIQEIISVFEGKAFVDYSDIKYRALKKQDHSKHPQHKLSSENKRILHTYLDKIRLKNYSIHTLKTYQNCFTIFLLYCEYINKEVEVVSKQEIETFMLRWKNKKNPNASYQNQMINAIKF